MKPTDEELNRKAAEVCDPARMYYDPFPDYCTDRNVLPELWDCLKMQEKQCEYESELIHMLPKLTVGMGVWAIVNYPPRLHVIAALKALGQWPEEWEV